MRPRVPPRRRRRAAVPLGTRRFHARDAYLRLGPLPDPVRSALGLAAEAAFDLMADRYARDRRAGVPVSHPPELRQALEDELLERRLGEMYPGIGFETATRWQLVRAGWQLERERPVERSARAAWYAGMAAGFVPGILLGQGSPGTGVLGALIGACAAVLLHDRIVRGRSG